VDYLWTPWRYHYVTKSGGTGECVFCAAAASVDDKEALIVHRAAHNFIILNRFPYTNGHVMVAPYRHSGSLGELDGETLTEMIGLARDAETRIRTLYGPDGLNIGVNIGKAAGAGIADHLHMHVLPRWFGDTNFMTVTGEARVLPEELSITWERLRAAFA
jgi:ATP adenylyltransferase